ncbi:P-type conjugative transfer protein TrbL [Desulfobulbus elongatus]|uniref:P-type conjugative transfer protein TrbL n=1 Tax=Desulfobulbus elongatus TaxID=53332 RepID=UPI00146FB2B8|nr:P-type conjugative transfer protein TrbL [Desulfobulbus elongatus]
MKRSCLIFFCLFFAFLFMAPCCQAADINIINQLAAKFATVSGEYGRALEKYAQSLFKWCLILDVALLGIRAALGLQEIGDTIKQFIMVLLFAGFCFAVITHYQEWTGNIINGMSGIATDLAGQDVSSPFQVGYDVTKKIMAAGDKAVMTKLGYIIAALVIMAIFALMGARMLLVLCESYIAINAAVLLLGFGGSGLLKEYAINTMRYALSVAFKMFVMQLVVAIGLKFMMDFSSAAVIDLMDVALLIGCAVALLVLIDKIPEICAGIITGSHHGGGQGLGVAASGIASAAGGAVGGMAGAAMGTGRGLSSIKAAMDIAGPQGGGKTAWARGGETLKNLGDAYSTARRQQNAWGSTGQRMNSILKDQRDVSRATNAPPQQEAPKVDPREEK